MISQLQRWQGDFGDQYTDRNDPDWHLRRWTFSRLIPAEVGSVLEVGCNRGHNLVAIRDILKLKPERVIGIEPNKHARTIAESKGLNVWDGDIYDIRGPQFDLVLTCGVLIHVPPARLDDALTELHEHSMQYLLAIEYPASTDTTVTYRGYSDMLWKRSISDHFQRLFPDLRLRGCADLDERDGFADSRYWLLEKT